ncbi:MAG: hypothetical protein ACFB0G_09925 [Leptolyngbyaceae cyanobacterium]|mgnify:CR=1 FL=1
MKAIAMGIFLALIGVSSCTVPAEEATPESDPTLVPVEPQQLDLWRAMGAFLAENGDPYSRFHSEFIDLNQDATEDALVLLGPPNWCGTGGCTLLVFEGVGEEFQLRSQISLVQTPLTVSERLTSGWQDLVLRIAGGGAVPKTVLLSFEGQGYPPNPSLLDPLPADSPLVGTEVFPGLVDFRAIGDTAGLAAACQQAIAAELDESVNLEFARTDEGGSAYSYTLVDGSPGTCRVTHDGIVEYVQ